MPTDPKLEHILNLILAFAQGRLDERIKITDPADELDAIALGLNMLGEELFYSKKELSDQRLHQQRLITEATISTQEKEREQLASELHDNINQVLATIKMYLGLAIEGQNEQTKKLLLKTLEFTDYAIEEIRKLSKTLVAPSLKKRGLVRSLENLVYELNAGKRIKIIFLHNLVDEGLIHNDLQLMLFRIIQELLNNIYKHSGADKVTIDLNADLNNISLAVSDNGIGFDTAKHSTGIGLHNIRSRVAFYSGTMSISCLPGMGCTITLNIPISKPAG